MFYQLSMLRFNPVVNGEMYKTWKDLDGADIAVHGRVRAPRRSCS